ncbi:betaine/proline/choline family ABC transporter ATP-binding protein (plasmid) [Pseudohalocynthiibacter aestuariivivens]|nr:betaine/proline/choline family ABC transporter ATP-binding protein [Pseudohalocynthiibacter aestuariivivens]QIE48196.1 betaine/proline/choline family ABC transporter ATP-binding protein [Pseudohalocynthiibacter aestuariivivens]
MKFSSTKEVVLSCRNVWKIYGPNPDKFFTRKCGKLSDPDETIAEIRSENHITAAANVSFDLHRGEIFVIMGLSGSGKSTVVRCLSRLVEPTAGAVLIEGHDLLSLSKKELIDIRRNKMGMVFQAFGLLPHLNVIENIAFPLKLQGISEKERFERARRVIDLVELNGREHNFPDQLSGGQQQRVGIARSLAVEPDIWFLDEPFSALDPLIRRQMQDEFLRIQQVLHKSIVFITHDFLEALRIADRIMIMKDGEVVQIGTPLDLILNPADDYVFEFTSDVPWERILHAEDVMRPIEDRDKIVKGRVAHNTSVEDLLPYLAEHEDGVLVEDENGLVLGVATARGVVKALATGSEDRQVVREVSTDDQFAGQA